MADDKIGLADAIAAIRSELAQAQAEAKGPVRFEVGDIELEFTVALTRDASVDAGIKAWVVSLGSKLSESQADTHRVQVTLHPTDEHGNRLRAGGEGRPG